MDDKRILLIRTGGTIDARPYGPKYDLQNPPRPVKTLKGKHSPVLQKVNALFSENMEVFDWGWWKEKRFVKDSSQYSNRDIRDLADIIKNDDRRYFIITHGTDAMVENARKLKQDLKGTDKVVAFVGAMVPLSMDGTYLPSWKRRVASDGLGSLNYVYDTITTQRSGVYVVASEALGLDRDIIEKSDARCYFDPDEEGLRKNRKESSDKLTFLLDQGPPSAGRAK